MKNLHCLNLHVLRMYKEGSIPTFYILRDRMNKSEYYFFYLQEEEPMSVWYVATVNRKETKQVMKRLRKGNETAADVLTPFVQAQRVYEVIFTPDTLLTEQSRIVVDDKALFDTTVLKEIK